LKHVVAHNFIFNGPTCINFMKLHVASHQWHNMNNDNNLTPHPIALMQLMFQIITTIVLNVYSNLLKALCHVS
jgi:hypothetical protein